MQAWERYKASERFANTKRWANESADYVEGSLWAAFLDGWQAAHGLTGAVPLSPPAAAPVESEGEAPLWEVGESPIDTLDRWLAEGSGRKDHITLSRDALKRLRARLTSGGEETAEPSDALGYVVVEHWEHPQGTKWSLTRNVIHSTYDGAVNAKPSDFTNFYGRRFTYTVARVTPAPTEEPT
jgi:hypothetical protein